MAAVALMAQSMVAIATDSPKLAKNPIWMRNSGRNGSMIIAVYRKSKSVVEVLN